MDQHDVQWMTMGGAYGAIVGGKLKGFLFYEIKIAALAADAPGETYDLTPDPAKQHAWYWVDTQHPHVRTELSCRPLDEAMTDEQMIATLNEAMDAAWFDFFSDLPAPEGWGHLEA